MGEPGGDVVIWALGLNALMFFSFCFILLSFVRRAFGTIETVIRDDRDVISGLCQDALIGSKGTSAEEVAKAATFAAHEREALKQQTEDHKAWRRGTITGQTAPVEEAQSRDTVRLATGEDMVVAVDGQGRSYLRAGNGDEYDILAGA